jgi:hypothetical protein
MKFDCKLCGIPLGDHPGTIPVIGETEDAKRGRYMFFASAHIFHMHPEVESQLRELYADLVPSILLSCVSTDDELILNRRRLICARIAQMVTPNVTDGDLSKMIGEMWHPESLQISGIRKQILLLLRELRDKLTGQDILEQVQAAAPKPKEETILQ